MTIHTLLLVRHGEASASWGDQDDPGLSEKGQNQAHALIDYFAKDDLNKYNFISSPKRRALETSQPLAKFYNKDVIACKAFSEIPSDNIPNERKQEWLKNIMLQEQIMLPDMVKDWKNRIMEELFLFKSHTIIFSHFMVINTIISSILNNQKLLHFYPDYTSSTQLILKDNEIKEIILGDNKKTLINL